MNEKYDFSKSKTLILGNGFLGQAFIRDGFDYFTTRSIFEIDNLNSIEYKLNKILDNFIYTKWPITTIINCIGIANTRFCEQKENFPLIKLVNGDAVAILSKVCAERGIKFVHISTGCLYTSSGFQVDENEKIEAHCNYTVSKWIGEMGCDYTRDLVLRPRLYFDSVVSPLNLICKFKNFKYILNEYNSVTSVDTIVEATKALLEHNQSGIFNVANDNAYTIKQLSEAIGYTWDKSQIIRGYDLVKMQNIYLVNNTMCLDKLKQFYTPRDACYEICRCANSNDLINYKNK